MDKNEKLIAQLNESTKGPDACKYIERLDKLAQAGDSACGLALCDYVKNGRVPHMRGYAAARLVDHPEMVDKTELLDTFKQCLDDINTRFWCISGLAKVAGKDCYDELCTVALTRSNSLEHRANAINCLARLSKQPFNLGFPQRLASWKEDELPLQALESWIKQGFPDGVGAPRPVSDPSLKEPKTRFEQTISAFDNRLEILRRKNPDDLTNPSNYLLPASKELIEKITSRWKLPSNYLNFLTRFSPFNMICELRLKGVYNSFRLYGADKLIRGQNDYAVSSITGEIFPEWPAEFVVIGAASADPFVLDLSSANASDGPIYTAEHGMGDWSFEPYAKSFEVFIKGIRCLD